MTATRGGYTIRRCGVDDVRARWDLLEQHRDAVPSALGQKIEPSWLDYYMLEEVKHLIVLGVYLDDVLVGYSVAVVRPHHHDTKMRVAQSDLIFLAAPYRKSTGLGLCLIAATESAAREAGCEKMLWAAPIGGPLDRVMKRNGYKPHETIYVKEL